MDFVIFDFLETVSPWWWVALGILLGAIEMATLTFFLIWPGLAAVLMAPLIALFPAMPGEVQVAMFASLSVGLTFAGRQVMHRYGDGGPVETTLNNRTARMIGRRGIILHLKAGEATVEIDGVQWRAILVPGPSIAAGDMVEVTAARGSMLEVHRVDTA